MRPSGNSMRRVARRDGFCFVETLRAAHEVAAGPSVGQPGSQGIFPALQLTGHIIGRVLDAFPVVGPSGGEVVLPDALAVDPGFEPAPGGDVEPGRHGCFASRVKERRRSQAGLGWLRFGSGASIQDGGPGLAEESGLEPADG